MALPGIQTIIQDKFFTLSKRNVPSGPSIVVIGYRNTADGTNGVPSLEPFLFTNESDVINAYGLGSALHRAYLELVAAGAVRISLVALPFGTTDSNLTDTSPGNPVDAAFAATFNAVPDIIVPWGRGGHPDDWTAAGSTPDYPPASPTVNMPLGFQADNSSGSTSLAVRAAQAVANITLNSHPCFAVMGLSPYIGANADATENVPAAKLATYLTYPGLISHDSALFNTSDGHSTAPYLSVVSAEMRPVSYSLSFGYSNGACMYAGLLSNLAAFNSATGQNAINVSNVRWTPTRSQQAALSSAEIVPLALDANRVPVWVDSPTYAPTDSDFSRLTTLRIVFDAVQLVRQASKPFIGQGATLANQQAFQTAISSALRNMQIAGALTNSDFSVTYSPVSNTAEVDLVLTPVFEIRTIIISVSVNLGG